MAEISDMIKPLSVQGPIRCREITLQTQIFDI